MFILSEQVFQGSSISSHTVHAAWSIALSITRWCRPDIMRQSGAAEVRILIENLYKFKMHMAKQLIRVFREKRLKCQRFK